MRLLVEVSTEAKVRLDQELKDCLVGQQCCGVLK